MIQENWSIICRKFPLVCVLNLCNLNIDDIKKTLVSYDSQFDKVVIITSDISQQQMDNFCKNERIINVSFFRESDLIGNSFDEKIDKLLSGQMIVVFSSLDVLDTNVRWKIYDKVKEMKSPLTDVVRLNKDCNYSLSEDISFSVFLRLS